jgi:type II secretory pathway component PulC
MVLWLAKLLSGWFGLDLQKVQRWIVIAVAFVIILVVLFVGKWIFGLFHHAPKLNQAEITKAQTAIAKQDREEMIKILVDSDVREKAIDENVAYANTQTVNAIAESKKQWSSASNDEMAAELERRAQEP